MKTDLREYFDFLIEPAEVIQLRGTRIHLEMIVGLFNEGMLPEQLQNYFVRSLTLDQVYAAITFYLMNRDEVEAYIRRGEESAARLRKEYEAAHPENAALRERLVGLKRKFTRPDGEIDFKALKAFVEAERLATVGEPVGAA